MQFKQGTHVYTSDGQDAGTVDRVVLDPQTSEVSSLVVRKGWLFIEDKVVPLSLVGSATDDRITLRETKSDLQKLPQFEETYYVRAADEGVWEDKPAPTRNDYAEPFYSYPPVGAAWWGAPGYIDYLPGDLQPEFVARSQKNIPEGNVAVREGAHVISRDGKHVGDVEEVFTDPTTNHVTHIVISQGVLFKDRKVIPTNWIKAEGEEEVTLTVDTKVVDDLPEYAPTA
ncbi:MAG: hypothetical protein GC204_17990 [Chloroflexi bacterium]|nr:hypothetical protein [Chloroflexota bacterium]